MPVGILLTTYVTVLLTFTVAYLDPTKSTLVTINSYNEANIELILLLFSAPSVYRFTRDYIKVNKV